MANIPSRSRSTPTSTRSRKPEKAFKVTVTRVNTAVIRGKNKRSRQGRPSMTSDYKKAVVTLKAGDKIELV